MLACYFYVGLVYSFSVCMQYEILLSKKFFQSEILLSNFCFQSEILLSYFCFQSEILLSYFRGHKCEVNLSGGICLYMRGCGDGCLRQCVVLGVFVYAWVFGCVCGVGYLRMPGWVFVYVSVWIWWWWVFVYVSMCDGGGCFCMRGCVVVVVGV